MPDTGAPWNLPYVASADLVADWPTDNQTQMEAIADALDDAFVIQQVVSTFKNNAFSTTSTSFVDITGMTVDITPSTATNKVLVIVSIQVSHSLSDGAVLVNLRRGSTNIAQPASGTDAATNYSVTPSNATMATGNFTFLDSPATTSQVTYSLQGRVVAGTGYLNRSGTDSNRTGVSSITVLEVSA